MVAGFLQNFSPPDGFWENWLYGRRRSMDACITTTALLTQRRTNPWMCQQELKIGNFLTTAVCITLAQKFLDTKFEIETKWPPESERYPHVLPPVGVPESQILVPFALRPAVFELHAIFRKVYRLIPKWHWTREHYKVNGTKNHNCTSSVALWKLYFLKKIQVHRLTSKWLSALHGQRYSILYHSPKFHLTSISHFQDFWHFSFPHCPQWKNLIFKEKLKLNF